MFSSSKLFGSSELKRGNRNSEKCLNPYFNKLNPLIKSILLLKFKRKKKEELYMEGKLFQNF